MAVSASSRRVEEAFELFQLERRGDRVSKATLDFYPGPTTTASRLRRTAAV